MATSYRVTLTAQDGTTSQVTVDQEGWDTLEDECERTHPVCVRERQMRDGSWKVDAGWNRLEVATPAAAPERPNYVAEMEATARLNDAADRRQNRQDYYRRTGR
jgi:hypothetical protein